MPDSLAKASEIQRNSIGWLNGRWLSVQDMSVSVFDVGFRQSTTAVERLRTYNGKIFQVDAHLERWLRTIAALGISGLASIETIRERLNELIERNRSTLNQWHEAGVTMFATPGVVAGQQPTFAMHLNPIDLETCYQKRTHGQPLVVTDVQQPPAQSWPRGIKVRCRLHYYLADQFARSCSPGAIGVLIDQDGSITETSIANIAIIESAGLFSPPPERILGGITQSVIERIAEANQLNWSKQPISIQRMRNADEILLMGTDCGIWFVNRIDQRSIHGGEPGPIYQQLRSGFDQLVSEY